MRTGMKIEMTLSIIMVIEVDKIMYYLKFHMKISKSQTIILGNLEYPKQYF